jgi:hypothetical protein
MPQVSSFSFSLSLFLSHHHLTSYILFKPGGLPWWVHIVALPVLVKTIQHPLLRRIVRNSRTQTIESVILFRAAQQEPKLENKQKMMQMATTYMREAGWSPWTPWRLMPLVVSVTIFNSFALRGAIPLDPGALSTQGLAWFVDLTQSDPFVRLGLLTSAAGFLQAMVGVVLQRRQALVRFVVTVVTDALCFSRVDRFVFDGSRSFTNQRRWWCDSNGHRHIESGCTDVLVGICCADDLRTAGAASLLALERARQYCLQLCDAQMGRTATATASSTGARKSCRRTELCLESIHLSADSCFKS